MEKIGREIQKALTTEKESYNITQSLTRREIQRLTQSLTRLVAVNFSN
jgi:hypothetical protein